MQLLDVHTDRSADERGIASANERPGVTHQVHNE